jgi:hypothetical protein
MPVSTPRNTIKRPLTERFAMGRYTSMRGD